MPSTPKFQVIRVSQESDDVVQDLEQALILHAKSTTPYDTFSLLSFRRHELYKRIEALEQEAGITGVVTRRFS